MSLSAAQQLTCDLITRPSITPDDAGCQILIAQRLEKLGFKIESTITNGVTNLWARYGTAAPLLAFVGHTDVVPTGSETQWDSPPFEPTVREGFLYGRGAADMKSAVAAIVVACEEWLSEKPTLNGSIALLLTSDEEGPAVHGTQVVVEKLKARGERIDYCLVGEPSSRERVGDKIKHGRRGSLSGILRLHGKQGHVAYPEKANNPIHLALPVLQKLIAEKWDEGDAFFQPTRLQLSNIQSGTGAHNVIPQTLEVKFNLRFSPVQTAAELKKRLHALLDSMSVTYEFVFEKHSESFLTPPGVLVDACVEAIHAITKVAAELSTEGGTSDGRFVAIEMGSEVVEVGVCNETIHQVNEKVRLTEIDELVGIYKHVMQRLLSVTT